MAIKNEIKSNQKIEFNYLSESADLPVYRRGKQRCLITVTQAPVNGVGEREVVNRFTLQVSFATFDFFTQPSVLHDYIIACLVIYQGQSVKMFTMNSDHPDYADFLAQAANLFKVWEG